MATRHKSPREMLLCNQRTDLASIGRIVSGARSLGRRFFLSSTMGNFNRSFLT
jgi:hypothetical protein